MPITLTVAIVPDDIPSTADVPDESKSEPDFLSKQKKKEEGDKPKQKHTPWEEWFDELVEYKEKNGNCNVPQRLGALGKWVNKQRTAYRKGKLSQMRTSKLEGIGFNWAQREKSEFA